MPEVECTQIMEPKKMFLDVFCTLFGFGCMYPCCVVPSGWVSSSSSWRGHAACVALEYFLGYGKPIRGRWYIGLLHYCACCCDADFFFCVRVGGGGG